MADRTIVTDVAATRPVPAAASILIVDDDRADALVLSEMLGAQGYVTRHLESGSAGLRSAEEEPPDLVLLKTTLPDMDGYEACRALKSNVHLRDIPVVLLSSGAGTEDKVRTFAVQAADYLIKPFQLDEVRARVDTHLQLRHLRFETQRCRLELQALVEQQVRETADSQMATIFALAKLAESRDDETGKHLEHVQALCGLLGTRMMDRQPESGIDDAFIANLEHASPLHDIGKVAIPDSILLKPGALTPEEFEIMKTHTVQGARTLEAVRQTYSRSSFIDMGIDIARSHHERWDGACYPDRLAGIEIPLSARITAVVDVYDAARTRRCYKGALTHKEVCRIILGEAGKQFDPDVVAAFRELQQTFNDVWRQMLG